MTPKLGERVLFIPQSHAWLTNTHEPERHAIGRAPHVLTGVIGQRYHDAAPPHQERNNTIPSWETFTSTLLRKGFGVMVVRDGKLEVGPSDWDSGD